MSLFVDIYHCLLPIVSRIKHIHVVLLMTRNNWCRFSFFFLLFFSFFFNQFFIVSWCDVNWCRCVVAVSRIIDIYFCRSFDCLQFHHRRAVVHRCAQLFFDLIYFRKCIISIFSFYILKNSTHDIQSGKYLFCYLRICRGIHPSVRGRSQLENREKSKSDRWRIYRSFLLIGRTRLTFLRRRRIPDFIFHVRWKLGRRTSVCYTSDAKMVQ